MTLGKGEQKLKDIPQSVSVMTRKQMDDQNTTKLSEVVKRTPGLTATKSPGPGMFIFSTWFEVGTLQYDGVGIPRATPTRWAATSPKTWRSMTAWKPCVVRPPCCRARTAPAAR